ncbi:hypothetical protein [Microvirga calopogonii]|uniref:hypothetical protein n=1 Tax=Microvirga calopogonii TaxID=2078013 RepID=UPI000E0DA89D|nr:hypothetical protein [Microvirga calopogonii]
MKRPIDIKRESAFQMEIAIPPGAELGPMFGLGGRLYAVSSKSIHAVQMADSIDPKRENENIPNVQQLVLNYGSDDEFIGRILLTALSLLVKGPVREGVDKEAALKKIFEGVTVIAEMRDFRLDYSSTIQKLADSFDQRLKAGSFELPHYERLGERVKTFISKAANASQRLFDLYVQFYGMPKDLWTGVKNDVEQRYGAGDAFAGFMTQAEPFLRFVRNMRHCIEHEKETQRIVVTDFELRSDGQVHLPTIEVIHPSSPEPQIDLGAFLTQAEESIVTVYEHMIVLIASKHVVEAEGLDFRIVELPKERWHKHVRFGYHPFRKDGTPL